MSKPFSTSLALIINNFDAHYLLEAPQPHVSSNIEKFIPSFIRSPHSSDLLGIRHYK